MEEKSEAKREYTCPVCKQPILGEDDWVAYPLAGGEPHHLECLERQTAYACVAVDLVTIVERAGDR